MNQTDTTPLFASQGEDSDSFEETDLDSVEFSHRGPSTIFVSESYSNTTNQEISVVSGTPLTHHRPKSFFIYQLAFFAAIGGFLFGYDTGVVSGAMIIVREVFQLSPVWEELVVSITIGAAAFFSPFGGIVNDRWGRKTTILLASVVFTFGAIVLGSAMNRAMLLVGRLILGVGIGLSSTTVPMYIAESAPSIMRGKLVTFYNMSVTAGQFIAGITDGAFSYLTTTGWRYMLGLASVPAVVQFVGFLFMPETPRFLLSQGKETEARKVLEKIWGHSDVDDEIKAIERSIEEDRESGGTRTICRMLTTPPVRKALIVGCGLQVFQQICGINTVMYYSATIIKMSGVRSPSVAIWLAALTASANFLFSFVGLYLVDRIGRRPLTIGSLFGTAISLMVLAIGFQVAANHSPPVTMVENTTSLDTMHVGDTCATYSVCDLCTKDPSCGFCYQGEDSKPQNASCVPTYQDKQGKIFFNGSMYGRCSHGEADDSAIWMYSDCPGNIAWLTTLGLVLYLASFAPGMGPMPWTINAEIYPTWARSTGNALSTMTNWSFNLIISMTFLTLTETLTTYGAFWLYSGFSIVGIIFLSLLLPETKGKSLEEMERVFQNPVCTRYT